MENNTVSYKEHKHKYNDDKGSLDETNTKRCAPLSWRTGLRPGEGGFLPTFHVWVNASVSRPTPIPTPSFKIELTHWTGKLSPTLKKRVDSLGLPFRWSPFTELSKN